uniref:Truncated rhabdoviral-like polymerase n=1 Tax=Aedes aegypti TaxID=7159 RepID=G3EBU3_AEDAE|nr:truncated rhabdoviral-like polymerase [Aedes aegypti]
MAGFATWADKIEDLPREIHNALAVVEDLQEILNEMKRLQERVDGPDRDARAVKRHRGNKEFKPVRSLDGQYIAIKDFVILDMGFTTWILPHVFFLELYGKLTELANLLMYLHAASGTSMPANHWVQSLSFLRHCLEVLLRPRSHRPCLHPDYQQITNDNSGFIYLKTMEALGVGIMSMREDLENFQVENRLLLDTMWQALIDDGIVTESSIQDSELYSILWPLETNQVADLIGVVKIFGHPSISIIEGLQQLDERVHKHLVLDEAALRNSLGIMIRDLNYNFFKRHRKYPNLDPTSLSGNIRFMVSQNIDPTARDGYVKFFAIPLTEWAEVRFTKNAEFDRADSQLTLIKDKALGLPRSEVLKRFILPIDARHRTKPRNRRALLAYLMTPAFTEDFQDYLASYMMGDDFNDEVLEYLVIKLTAKELELKEKGRFFGASPMEERIRRQVQERNVMQLMDKYVPEQLLTCGELDGIHKLTSFKKLASTNSDATVVHVSADFSSWNHNFRRETVDETAGVVLDSWFGGTDF